MVRFCRLELEVLEDRRVPATFGIPWSDPSHLTLSFAPDGTSVLGRASNLFGSLGATVSTSAWEREVLRAFQTWAASAEINIGLVADGGQALGTAGLVQGDARFGDLRIVGRALSPEVLAITTPSGEGSTLAGDVIFNTAQTFGIGPTSALDLYSVALHEAGHALGIADSSDPTSAMYEDYHGVRTGLSAADVSAVQALYGARQPEAFTTGVGGQATHTQTGGKGGNDTFATAAKLAPSTTVSAEIAAPGEADFYAVKVPKNASRFSVTLQASGLSLLTARLSVFDANQQLVQSAVATDPTNGNLTISLPSFAPRGTYYLKVEGATTDVFGLGAYRLQTNFGNASGQGENNSGDGDKSDDGKSEDNNTGPATTLSSTVVPDDPRFTYSVQGAFQSAGNAHVYQFQAPSARAGSSPATMTVTAWGLSANGPSPRLLVYDSHRNLLVGRVVTNDDGSYSLRIAGVAPGSAYYVVAMTDGHAWTGPSGGYFLGVGFSASAPALPQVAAGTLSAAQAQDFRTLTVTEAQLFHFELSADGGTAGTANGLRMTIFNQAGEVMATQLVLAGQSADFNVLLGAGTYTICFSAGTQNGSALQPLAYSLTGTNVSDPIGLGPVDPTLNGASSAPPVYTFTVYAYTYYSDLYNTILAINDPYSKSVWN